MNCKNYKRLKFVKGEIWQRVRYESALLTGFYNDFPEMGGLLSAIDF